MYLDRWMERKYNVKVENESDDLSRRGLKNIKVYEKNDPDNHIAIIKNIDRYNHERECSLWVIESENIQEDIIFTEKEIQGIVKRDELKIVPKQNNRPRFR